MKEAIEKFEADMEAAIKSCYRNERVILFNDIMREFKSELAKTDENRREVGVAPKVDLGLPFNFADSRYKRGNCGWLAASLYKKAEEDGLKPFHMPLACIDMTVLPFQCKNMDDFVWHMKRCMAADTNIPIILDDYGQIADGNHRVLKAILDGDRYIMAFRLKNMPPVDYKEDDNA